MNFSFGKIYKDLSIPEANGRKIGLFRALSAIFGGLFVSYLGMSVLTLMGNTPGEAIIIPLLFNTFAWSVSALWISLAPSKLSALLRVIIPSLVFLLLILMLF